MMLPLSSRSAELFALGRGASLVYSSIRNFKNDLQARHLRVTTVPLEATCAAWSNVPDIPHALRVSLSNQAYKPQFLIVVPRLLESVHKSITDKFALQPPAKRRLVAVLSAVCVLYHTCLRRAKVRAHLPKPLHMFAFLGCR